MRSPVRTLQDTFVLGMLVGDPDLCASVYAADAVLVPPDHEMVFGRREIRDFWERVIDGGSRGDAVITETIEMTGQDRIIEHGHYARFTEPVLLDRPRYADEESEADLGPRRGSGDALSGLIEDEPATWDVALIAVAATASARGRRESNDRFELL